MSDPEDELQERRFKGWIKLAGSIYDPDTSYRDVYEEALKQQFDAYVASPDWRAWWTDTGYSQLLVFLYYASDPPFWKTRAMTKLKGENIEITRIYRPEKWARITPAEARVEVRTIITEVARKMNLPTPPDWLASSQ